MNAVSEEQQQIINNIQNNKNVIVDACAGSGKSTTILSTAKSMPHKRFLLITYNKSLRKEIIEKVNELQLRNIVVHTYHSLAVATYHPDAHVDRVMRLIVANNESPRIQLTPFDVVVLDEVQDMTFLYYRLVVKYIKDIGAPILMMILGDYMQGLYEFKGADIRFLTMANQIWTGFPLLVYPEFVECKLKMSYRITNPIADFVNNAMLGETRLYACKEGEPVCYIRRRIYELQRIVVATIRDLIETKNVQPSDIFVLGGSVKGPNSRIRKIENALVESGIPCHVPMIETSDNFDENVIKGKIVFSSFHTSKGRQRPYVFIVGFDNSYFKTIAKTLDPNVCPNTLYVATTRASTKMYLLESDDYRSDRPFKFLKLKHHEMKTTPYIDFRGIPQSIFEDSGASCAGGANSAPTDEETVFRTTPSEMTRFISEAVLEEITVLLDQIFIKETASPLDEIALPTVLKTRAGFYEDVSDLNGIAIPSLLYDYIINLYTDDTDTSHATCPCILYDMIVQTMSQTKPNKHLYLKGIVLQLDPVCSSIEDYLYMANVYEATQEKLYFKLNQIERDEYTWLTPDVLSQCKHRLLSVLEEEIMMEKPEIEKTIIQYDDDLSHALIQQCLSPYFSGKEVFQFTARIDLMTHSTLWELKCTSEITAEHMIQTVIYAWIMRTIDPKFSRTVKIFNIRTGQILRLDAEKSTLDKIVVSLLKGKYVKQEPISDDMFVRTCRKSIHVHE